MILASESMLEEDEFQKAIDALEKMRVMMLRQAVNKGDAYGGELVARCKGIETEACFLKRELERRDREAVKGTADTLSK